MDDIVRRRLTEWTEGLGSREARIRVFEGVRDIPYEVIPRIRTSRDGPRGILEMGRGSCTPKHFLLGRMFEAMGLGVRYVTYPFPWDQKGVDYPDELRRLAAKLPTEYHLAIHAEVEGRWARVDATWDLPLWKVGFPVNKEWDGASDTKIAVDYIEEVVHASAEERDEYVQGKKSEWSPEDFERAGRFVEGLNAWLRQVRGE